MTTSETTRQAVRTMAAGYLNDLLSDAHREVLITQMESGFHVKDLTGGTCVDVLQGVFCWHLVRTTDPAGAHETMDRAWCYPGALVALLHAYTEALDWDGADDTEPAGWRRRLLEFDGHPRCVVPL